MANSPDLCLSPELFSNAFPFHFIFNPNREILQAGVVLQRIISPTLVGSSFEQHFQINRPTVKLEFESIRKQSHSFFMLECLCNGMQLRGQMMYAEAQNVMFFLGSPWITDTAKLAPFGIKLKDFAIHDPIVDFLFLLQAQNTALMDAKKLTKELTQQQSQLRSALQLKENLAEIAESHAQKLRLTIEELQRTQTQLIQTEKMSSLGQLVAGVAHEINNPVNFIYGNLDHVDEYMRDLLNLIELYQKNYSNPSLDIKNHIETIDLDFLVEDFPKTIASMKVGTERIREIVLSLRNFSRLDESETKAVDIHEGIDSTLLILQNRLKAKVEHPAIEVVKQYSNLPLVECFAGQLNQVFMNILSNAIDALHHYNSQRSDKEILSNPSRITIRTELQGTEFVLIKIIDNGPGMTESVQSKLFDPFFTTKPAGKGTGLGLAISYQIVVEKHGGSLQCQSQPGLGTEFRIQIPLRRRGDR